ncbi:MULTISPECIES: methyltransferase domain-containing protein [unclassified Methanobrevibacter]|uniref:methyltransferase domain-containing protein n=1 Tax=unclassified Methanobrevibacter TaxID=2638681 RepID=UPI0027326439|nr:MULTISPECIES: methyltransferase domain-containing protein [unclassified Methanobrevibacter]
MVFILNIDDKIKSLAECEKCSDIQIKKFSPLKDLIDFEILNGEYMKCDCGKRPLDIVMSHILKIMIEEETVSQKATLRRNSPVPLSNFYYSSLNPQFIGEDTLILLHPDFNSKIASRLINEVPEVTCVLRGSARNTVGQLDKNSQINHFEILEGDDTQVNVMRTLIGDKIVIVKNQSKHHIEVAVTTEQKLVSLHNYLENNKVKKGVAIDGMCGLGALGIYLLKYGFEKVIFNDINPEMIEALKSNLEYNGIREGYEILNGAFEDLDFNHVDLCLIDAFPGIDTEGFVKKAEKIADNVFKV